MKSTPTGAIEDGNLVLVRRFGAPIDDVWASLTESDRLERWIGRYEGDPASGQVDFYMTAEAEDIEATSVMIEVCQPPSVLQVTQLVGDAPWRLRAELTPTAEGTTLTFRHLGLDPESREMVGPGWEYYLDRWRAAVDGDDVSAFDFDRDYYPAMGDYYRSLR